MTSTTAPPITDRPIDAPNGLETVWFLQTSKETKGARTYVEAHLKPGAANETHFHTAFAETFEVLQGTLHVEVDGQTLRLEPGQTATVPTGSRHRFANNTAADVRFRCALEPASRGFEEAMQIMAGLAKDDRVRGDLPKDPRILGLLMDLADSRLCGATRALTPVLNLAAALGRKRGLEAELRDRYVRW